MPIISVTNQKGGVGKTTMLASLAQILTEQGCKVLCIDLDPQRNLDMMAGPGVAIRPGDKNTLSVLHMLNGECTLREAIVQTPIGDLARASNLLSSWVGQRPITREEFETYRYDPQGLVRFLDERFSRIDDVQDVHVLRECMKGVADEYDFVFLDTNPSLMLLTMNALYAADYVLIPVFPDEFSREAIGELWNTIQAINYYEPGRNLQVAGIVMTKVNRQAVVSRAYEETLAKIASHINTVLFNTKIRQSVIASEATTARKTVVDYNRYSDVAADYRRFAKEFVARIEQLTAQRRDT